MNQRRAFFLITSLILTLFSCSLSLGKGAKDRASKGGDYVLKQELQSLLDDSKLMGTILIYDARHDRYFSNDFSMANMGKLPASTFKIPHTIIALETGVIQSDTTWLKWDGRKRAFKIWEQDLRLRDAFRYSCLPCYQQIAKKIGTEQMEKYIQKLHYGKMHVTASNLDKFWIEGNARISPIQQIDFLNRLVNTRLPISKRTEDIVKRMMLLIQNDDYSLYGKTGWSTWQGVNNGWFVGYVRKGPYIYYFATNIEPKAAFDMKSFAKIRKTITYSALRQLGVIP